MRRVVLETPYKGNNWENTEKNVDYARRCFRDCLKRGDNPFASHLVYTQPGILDDKIPEERQLGINAGLEWGELAEATVAYIDRGIYSGMKYGIEAALALKPPRPVEYHTLHPLKIITLTGQSGVGKSTIAKKLMELRPETKLVISETTRGPRPTDLPGEYNCLLAKEELKEKGANGELLWLAEAYGNSYATAKKSVAAAIVKDAPSLMILVPGVIMRLRDYVGDDASVASFYVLAPSGEELRMRFLERGDAEESVVRRIEESRRWDEEAKKSGLPYIFITNDEHDFGEKATKEILKYTSQK